DNRASQVSRDSQVSRASRGSRDNQARRASVALKQGRVDRLVQRRLREEFPGERAFGSPDCRQTNASRCFRANRRRVRR
ncbi:MAG: hypothetical protein WCI95_01855, partial [bacterium]